MGEEKAKASVESLLDELIELMECYPNIRFYVMKKLKEAEEK